MRGIFSVDGKFYSITSKILDMVIVSVLWLIGCIPIITFFTSTSSMYHTVVKCIRYERGKVFEEFKEAYKKNLKQGIELTLFYGMIGAVIVFLDYRIFIFSQSRTSMQFILAVGMLILTVVYISNLFWNIPVFSRFSNTFGRIIQLNFVISIRYIIRGILLALIAVVVMILFLASNELIIILPALMVFAMSYISESVMHLYMPNQEEDNGDWRYGYK